MTVDNINAKPISYDNYGRVDPRTPVSRDTLNNARSSLKDTYYLDNFNFLINFVSDHYQTLLQAEEKQFLQSYTSLPVEAQQLFVRLVLRAHAFLRISKINYLEIDVPSALEKLGKTGFVNLDIDAIEHCLPLFTRQELSTALGVTSTKAPSFDSEIWTTTDLFGESPTSKLFNIDSVIEVKHKLTVQTFRLLFFGNLYQDFSAFVLRDLGYQRFESYNIDSENLPFTSREQIEAHLTYYQCCESFDNACNPDSDIHSRVDSLSSEDALIKLHKALPQKIADDKVLCRRLDRLNNRIARQLERETALESAADIYSKSVHPPARERLARIRAKTGHADEALALCKQIIQSSQDTDELDFAYRFGCKLSQKISKQTSTNAGKTKSTSFPIENKYLPPESILILPKSNLSVEFSVATHLAKTGKCYYLENSLISGVFGLAFWDIIFAQVNSVFFHPFQSKPADFYESDFIRFRKLLISKRLEEISQGMLRRIVNDNLYHKRGVQNPMVNWHLCRKHIIDLALSRIPADTWRALFEQILSDIKNYRSGQPDLAFFPDSGGYQFIEVKAPGDKLQKNQLRWMKFFDQQNIPHKILNVEWLESSDEAG